MGFWRNLVFHVVKYYYFDRVFKYKYFFSEWNNEVHGHILSLLMDDDNCSLYIVVYPTFRDERYVTGNCVASILVHKIVSIQDTAYCAICYTENKFFVTERRYMCNGFGKYPLDHKTVFLLGSCFGLVAAVRHNVVKGGS
jgi:hypothetical protein